MSGTEADIVWVSFDQVATVYGLFRTELSELIMNLFYLETTRKYTSMNIYFKDDVYY